MMSNQPGNDEDDRTTDVNVYGRKDKAENVVEHGEEAMSVDGKDY